MMEQANISSMLIKTKIFYFHIDNTTMLTREDGSMWPFRNIAKTILRASFISFFFLVLFFYITDEIERKKIHFYCIKFSSNIQFSINTFFWIWELCRRETMKWISKKKKKMKMNITIILRLYKKQMIKRELLEFFHSFTKKNWIFFLVSSQCELDFFFIFVHLNHKRIVSFFEQADCLIEWLDSRQNFQSFFISKN